jgi:hypothetical protein
MCFYIYLFVYIYWFLLIWVHDWIEYGILTNIHPFYTPNYIQFLPGSLDFELNSFILDATFMGYKETTKANVAGKSWHVSIKRVSTAQWSSAAYFSKLYKLPSCQERFIEPKDHRHVHNSSLTWARQIQAISSNRNKNWASYETSIIIIIIIIINFKA